eukprot:CAMPEP_0179845770 /NCGR_PEP_ID=MMETSP0982-20121206/5200_1 /TAXON_ID=483367 /ORGANISM="non described non described, Strain CCMP 2436" /LENGTH=142 /DNA_ID=CAMNT_0021730857 /DNA_START=1179 /DNA_END=1604 /DNA_ORIENTATION=+
MTPTILMGSSRAATEASAVKSAKSSDCTDSRRMRMPGAALSLAVPWAARSMVSLSCSASAAAPAMALALFDDGESVNKVKEWISLLSPSPPSEAAALVPASRTGGELSHSLCSLSPTSLRASLLSPAAVLSRRATWNAQPLL